MTQVEPAEILRSANQRSNGGKRRRRYPTSHNTPLKFAAADTVAANGVHRALLIGKRYAVAPRQTDWKRELATFELELYCDSRLTQRGGGSLVLDSPRAALRHLIELLASDPHNPPLRSGEIISTGTLTLAMSVKLGERWTTTVTGIPLEEVTIRFN
jgi:2-oxo-3-hexenedioate decarboxylase